MTKENNNNTEIKGDRFINIMSKITNLPKTKENIERVKAILRIAGKSYKQRYFIVRNMAINYLNNKKTEGR